MKNTLVGHEFVVRDDSGVPMRFTCFGTSYGSFSQFTQAEVEVLFRNRGPEFGLSIEDGEEFVSILQEAISSVKGAQLKFRTIFDNPNKDMLEKFAQESKSRGGTLPYEEGMNTLTYFVDTSVTGNIAWFWLGAILRNFQNSPRTIINFLRIAKMKWNDVTVLEHWGFLHTWNLAHVIRMEPNEKGFKYGFYENYIQMNIGGFHYPNTIERYLLNNKPITKAGNYKYNSKGEFIQLFDNHARDGRKYLAELDDNGNFVCFGVYWDDGMSQDIINNLFEKLPKEAYE